VKKCLNCRTRRLGKIEKGRGGSTGPNNRTGGEVLGKSIVVGFGGGVRERSEIEGPGGRG